MPCFVTSRMFDYDSYGMWWSMEPWRMKSNREKLRQSSKSDARVVESNLQVIYFENSSPLFSKFLFLMIKTFFFFTFFSNLKHMKKTFILGYYNILRVKVLTFITIKHRPIKEISLKNLQNVALYFLVRKFWYCWRIRCNRRDFVSDQLVDC